RESQKISVPELKLLLEKSDPLVIDVRNASEIESSGSIASKRNINIPFIDLDKELCLSNEDFKVKYGVNKPLPDGSDAIFHCMKGGRGSKAVVVAEKQGMEKARNLEGGYSLWSSQ
uniref:Rhodanese domain-containing protein n=1 Tax=Ciona savignyi TaxID=51511 RepID=H2YHU8_CIOSA